LRHVSVHQNDLPCASPIPGRFPEKELNGQLVLCGIVFRFPSRKITLCSNCLDTQFPFLYIQLTPKQVPINQYQ
jgi:hypothetical protein